MSSPVAEKLRAIAQELREHPEHWTQGHMRRDAGGEYVSPLAPRRAVCWCALGLVSRDIEGDGWTEACVALEAAAKTRAISAWNDKAGRTAGEVADAFEAAAVIVEGDNA